MYQQQARLVNNVNTQNNIVHTQPSRQHVCAPPDFVATHCIGTDLVEHTFQPNENF